MRTLKYKPLFEAETFDMTPIIDVVFLLIIFFMLVAQFIVAEQYKVSVPDEITTAQARDSEKKLPLTITVMPNKNKGIVCAIGTEKMAPVEGKDMKSLITSVINDYLAEHEPAEKTVRLRCDRSVPFGQVKYILSGISQSRVENLDWAVLGE
jgi:biopolymer transport protein ExbD